MTALLLPSAGHAQEPEESRSLEQRVAELERAQEEQASLWDMVSVHGVLAWGWQGENSSGAGAPNDPTGWAIPFQPEVSITPTEQDEVFFKFGFAAGDGLNAKTNFNLSPWAADLASDVVDLSGGSRDHLLTAWYKHEFALGEEHSLGISGGIIDATDYIDQNAYSNDEYGQFMNESLVNGPNAFLPSYEPGAAFEWRYEWLGVDGVFMSVSEDEDGSSCCYYGVELSATAQLGIGEGNYRLIYNRGSSDFETPSGTTEEHRSTFLISCDQQLGEHFGAWIRLGDQSTDALVDYDKVYSGGVQLNGSIWGREQDSVGIGLGYLDGAEQTADSLSHTHVFEVYARFGLNDFISVTADLQFMRDDYVPAAAGSDVDGWIGGIRMAVEF